MRTPARNLAPRFAVTLAAVALSGAVAAGLGDRQAPAPVRDRPAQAATAGTATIRGSVVDAATGAPIRRAAVTLVIEAPDRERSSVVATTSDNAGQFEFVEVPAGRVQITASRAGYFDDDNVWTPDPEDPQWTPIAAGQRIQGVRIALARGGAIVGRVYDEYGEPAAGLEIEVFRRAPGDPARAVRGTSMTITPTTDDTGTFRVWGLAPGDYLVGARPNRFVAPPPADQEGSREGYALTFYPGTPMPSEARPVRVTAGRDTPGVAFGLVPVRLATLTGSVQVPPGLSGRDITIQVRSASPERIDGAVTAGTRARDDGSFQLSRVAPGTYHLMARSSTRGIDHFGSVDVTMAGSDVDGVSIAMRTGATLHGRVVNEAGEQVGTPVLVLASPATDGQGVPVPAPARTFSDGSFRMEGVFDLQQIRAIEARFAPEFVTTSTITSRAIQDLTPTTRQHTTWWLESVTVEGRDVTDVPADFTRGGDVNVVVTMTNRASSVRGTVTWAPLTGARRPAVVVFLDDATRWTRPTRVVGTSEVDESGRYEVRGLPPGDRYLAVAVDGISRLGAVRPEMLELLRRYATPLRIDKGGVHEVALRAVARPRP